MELFSISHRRRRSTSRSRMPTYFIASAIYKLDQELHGIALLPRFCFIHFVFVHYLVNTNHGCPCALLALFALNVIEPLSPYNTFANAALKIPTLVRIF